jgi:spore germination cell wall hydrolase CwlJ-like protein
MRNSKIELRWRLALLVPCLVGLAIAGAVYQRNVADRDLRLRAVRLAAASMGAHLPLRSAAILATAPTVLESLAPEQAVLENARVPISSAPMQPAAPFVLSDVAPGDRARALTCLTMAVYYEAGNQGPDGEAAVAQVVLNRLRSPLFPKSVCGVVFQGSSQSTGCQFTFTCDGSLDRPPSAAGWRQAGDVAERALNGYVQKAVGEATHYHTIWVVPYWQSTVVKIAQIGAHVFYRMSGGLGEPAAFYGRYAGLEPQTALPEGFDASNLLPKPPPAIVPVSAVTATTPTAPPVVLRPVPTAQAVAVVTLRADGAVSPQRGAVNLAPQPSGGYFGQQAPANPHLPM